MPIGRRRVSRPFPLCGHEITGTPARMASMIATEVPSFFELQMMRSVPLNRATLARAIVKWIRSGEIVGAIAFKDAASFSRPR